MLTNNQQNYFFFYVFILILLEATCFQIPKYPIEIKTKRNFCTQTKNSGQLVVLGYEYFIQDIYQRLHKYSFASIVTLKILATGQVSNLITLTSKQSDFPPYQSAEGAIMKINFNHDSANPCFVFQISTYTNFNPPQTLDSLQLFSIDSNINNWQDATFYVYFGTDIMLGKAKVLVYHYNSNSVILDQIYSLTPFYTNPLSYQDLILYVGGNSENIDWCDQILKTFVFPLYYEQNRDTVLSFSGEKYSNILTQNLYKFDEETGNNLLEWIQSKNGILGDNGSNLPIRRKGYLEFSASQIASLIDSRFGQYFQSFTYSFWVQISTLGSGNILIFTQKNPNTNLNLLSVGYSESSTDTTKFSIFVIVGSQTLTDPAFLFKKDVWHAVAVSVFGWNMIGKNLITLIVDGSMIFYFQNTLDTNNLNGSYQLYENLAIKIGEKTSTFTGSFFLNEFTVHQGSELIPGPTVNSDLQDTLDYSIQGCTLLLGFTQNRICLFCGSGYFRTSDFKCASDCNNEIGGYKAENQENNVCQKCHSTCSKDCSSPLDSATCKNCGEGQIWDSASSSCLTKCKDNIVLTSSNEECDPFNAVDFTKYCQNDCSLKATAVAKTINNANIQFSECGDGQQIQNQTEQCDVLSDPGCQQCQIANGYYCVGPQCYNICGDGQYTPEEACEDSNIIDGDGCSHSCTIEQDYFCYTPKHCKQIECGDGYRQDGIEQCDDGNKVSSDGCSDKCKIQRGYQCSRASKYEKDICAAICGDGFQFPSEECDDGDGCSQLCKIEKGFKCGGGDPFNQDICFLLEKLTKCGDGYPEGLEECDDGNNFSFDGCTLFCQKQIVAGCKEANSPEESQNLCQTQCPLENCVHCIVKPRTYCLKCFENHFFNNYQCEPCHYTCKRCFGPEPTQCIQCVDFSVFDRTSRLCQICSQKKGYEYSIEKQKCVDQCGDGEIFENECDDGNLIDFDGCSHLCETQSGYRCDKVKGLPSKCSFMDFNKELIPQIYLTGANDFTHLALQFNVVIKPFGEQIQPEQLFVFEYEDMLSRIKELVGYQVKNRNETDNKIFDFDLAFSKEIVQKGVLTLYFPNKMYIQSIQNITLQTDKATINLPSFSQLSAEQRNILQKYRISIQSFVYFFFFLCLCGFIIGASQFIFTVFFLLQSLYMLVLINLEFPENMVDVLDIFQITHFRFLRNSFTYLIFIEPENTQTDPQFEANDYNSVFLHNIYYPFIVWSFSFIMYISAQISQFIMNTFRVNPKSFTLRLMNRFTENFFFDGLLQVYGITHYQVVFASFLQFTNFSQGSQNLVFSQISSITFILLSPLIIYLNEQKGHKDYARLDEKIEIIPQGIQITQLFSYYSFLLIEQIINSFVLVNFPDLPIVQIGTPIVINSSMLIFMAVHQEFQVCFESHEQRKRTFLSRILVNIVLVSMASLYFDSKVVILDFDQKLDLGWVVNASLLIIIVVHMFYFLQKFLRFAKEKMESISKQRRIRIISQ